MIDCAIMYYNLEYYSILLVHVILYPPDEGRDQHHGDPRRQQAGVTST